MDPPPSDVPKLPDMVMCGDHPSFTKTELNAKEVKPEEKKARQIVRESTSTSYARISPATSRTERAISEHGLRALEARRRVCSLEAVQRADTDVTNPANRALVQAALGSFRWPPYLLCVWVVVLVLTHALYCLVCLLERTLPNLKKVCLYFRNWTEVLWRSESDINHRVYPILLACVTGALYSVYMSLLGAHALAVWAIEPLCPDMEDKPSKRDVTVKITDYNDQVCSKTNASLIKH